MMSSGSKWQEGCHSAQSGRNYVIGLKVAGRMSLGSKWQEGCHWAQSDRKDVIGLKVAGRMSLALKWQYTGRSSELF